LFYDSLFHAILAFLKFNFNLALVKLIDKKGPHKWIKDIKKWTKHNNSYTGSKQEVLSSIEKNICGKITRTLIEGSIEVYPIKDYGAIEIGYHKFYNNQEPNAKSKPSKFIVVWKNENEKWYISKVISLH